MIIILIISFSFEWFHGCDVNNHHFNHFIFSWMVSWTWWWSFSSIWMWCEWSSWWWTSYDHHSGGFHMIIIIQKMWWNDDSSEWWKVRKKGEWTPIGFSWCFYFYLRLKWKLYLFRSTLHSQCLLSWILSSSSKRIESWTALSKLGVPVEHICWMRSFSDSLAYWTRFIAMMSSPFSLIYTIIAQQ